MCWQKKRPLISILRKCHLFHRRMNIIWKWCIGHGNHLKSAIYKWWTEQEITRNDQGRGEKERKVLAPNYLSWRECLHKACNSLCIFFHFTYIRHHICRYLVSYFCDFLYSPPLVHCIFQVLPMTNAPFSNHVLRLWNGWHFSQIKINCLICVFFFVNTFPSRRMLDLFLDSNKESRHHCCRADDTYFRRIFSKNFLRTPEIAL